jgi:hypothetical protein
MMVRYFSFEDESVGFRIFYPVEENSEHDFSCRFETFGLKDNIRGKALGGDAICSLVNAMMRIDIFLKGTEEYEAGELRWFGGFAPDDFGLPWESAVRVPR